MKLIPNRSKKGEVSNLLFAKVTLLVLLTLSTKVNGQQFAIAPASMVYTCPNFLYYGVENPMKLLVKGQSNRNFNKIKLVSDSIVINKINDSLYTLKPLYERVYCKIYFVDTSTGKNIDSIKKYCDYDPFTFAITHINVAHEYYSQREVINEMKGLYMESKSKDCFDYTKDYFLVSYDLVLQRGETTILAVKLKGNQLIPSEFKNKLIETAKTGDGLFAKNIILEKNGQILQIPEYGLLKMK
jgi:hypothetical protein